MGRKKLPMRKIGVAKDRVVTFCKRRVGLLKKAAELAILCNVGVYLVFTDEVGAVHQFSSFPTNKESGVTKSAPSLWDVLEKVATGKFVPFKLDNYPFSGLEHHHNLDEFHRFDDFVSQIRRLLNQARKEISLKKRPPLRVKEMSIEERLESKKVYHPFPQRQEAKIKRQASQLRGKLDPVSLTHAIRGPIYAEGDIDDDSEYQEAKDDMAVEYSSVLDQALNEDYGLEVFKELFEVEQREFFTTNKFNLVRNEASAIDLLVYTLIMNKYFDKALEHKQRGLPENHMESGFEILRIASLKQAMSIAANLNLEIVSKDSSKLEDLQMITEYFLRLYVNPYLGKSKQVTYTLLNGIVTAVRSFYREISASMSSLYAESAVKCEDRFNLTPEITKEIHKLIEKIIYNMQRVEALRQHDIRRSNPIDAFQDCLRRYDIDNYDQLEFDYIQLITPPSELAEKPDLKRNRPRQLSKELYESIKLKKKELREQQNPPIMDIVKLKKSSDKSVKLKLEEPKRKVQSKSISPLIIKTEYKSDNNSGQSESSSQSKIYEEVTEYSKLKSHSVKEEEPDYENIAVQALLAQFQPKSRGVAYPTKHLGIDSPQRGLTNVTALDRQQTTALFNRMAPTKHRNSQLRELFALEPSTETKRAYDPKKVSPPKSGLYGFSLPKPKGEPPSKR